MSTHQKRILSVLVSNNPGVMTRVSGLFSRRGFNIDSIAVGQTEDPEVSRMTIVCEANEEIAEQLTKQLHKLIDVLKISDITSEPAVERELALVKVKANNSNRSEIVQIASIFRANIVHVGTTAVIIEVTGDEEKINALIELLKPHGIKELVRTGKIALVRA